MKYAKNLTTIMGWLLFIIFCPLLLFSIAYAAIGPFVGGAMLLGALLLLQYPLMLIVKKRLRTK